MRGDYSTFLVKIKTHRTVTIQQFVMKPSNNWKSVLIEPFKINKIPLI